MKIYSESGLINIENRQIQNSGITNNNGQTNRSRLIFRN